MSYESKHEIQEILLFGFLFHLKVEGKLPMVEEADATPPIEQSPPPINGLTSLTFSLLQQLGARPMVLVLGCICSSNLYLT